MGEEGLMIATAYDLISVHGALLVLWLMSWWTRIIRDIPVVMVLRMHRQRWL